LAGLFADLIGGLAIDDPIYVEPYAGGAGAAIALLRQGLVSRIHINDLDPAVHAFWHASLRDTDRLLARVNDVPLNLEEWHRQKAAYRALKDPFDFDLGFAFFYLNRTNRSGILNAGVIGGQHQSGTYKIDARFNRETLSQRIAAIGDLAHRVDLTHIDGRDVIQQYSDNRSAFMYIDPPYVEAGSSLYMNKFSGPDHTQLAETINAITEAAWLLTYDVDPLIKRLYSRNFQCRYELYYSARYTGRYDELMITSPTVAGELQRVAKAA
jgi:DNA adenine methylase